MNVFEIFSVHQMMNFCILQDFLLYKIQSEMLASCVGGH